MKFAAGLKWILAATLARNSMTTMAAWSRMPVIVRTEQRGESFFRDTPGSCQPIRRLVADVGDRNRIVNLF